MRGPRKDKERAWDRLEAQVRFAIHCKRAIMCGTYMREDPGLADECLRALKNLQSTGRLDARQIHAVRVLVRSLHAWCFSPSQGGIVAEDPGRQAPKLSPADVAGYCLQPEEDAGPDRGPVGQVDADQVDQVEDDKE